ARMASWLGPADAQMNLPESAEKNSAIGRAFSFLSASPVITTAPVSISLGVKPASAYAWWMNWVTLSVSIWVPVMYGVSMIFDRYSTSRSVTRNLAENAAPSR